MTRSKIILVFSFLAFASSGCSKFKVGKDFNPQAAETKNSKLDDLFRNEAPSGSSANVSNGDKNGQETALNWNQSEKDQADTDSKNSGTKTTDSASPAANTIADTPETSSLAGMTDEKTSAADPASTATPETDADAVTTLALGGTETNATNLTSTTTTTTTDGSSTTTNTTTQVTSDPSAVDHAKPFASGSSTPADAASTAGLVTKDPTGTGAAAAPTPKATTAATPKATPATTPKASPSPTPKATPAATPKATPATTPKATPAATPKATPAATPKATPATTPKASPATTPKASPATANATGVTGATTGATTGTGFGAAAGAVAGAAAGAKRTTKTVTGSATDEKPGDTTTPTTTGGIATISTNNLKNVPVDNKLGGGTVGTTIPGDTAPKTATPATTTATPVIATTSKSTTQTGSTQSAPNSTDILPLKNVKGETLRSSILWTLISDTEKFLKHIQTVKTTKYAIAARKLDMSAAQMCRTEDNKALVSIFDPKITNGTFESSRYMNTASPLRDRIFQLKRSDIQPGQDLNSSASAGLAGEKDMMGLMTHLTMDMVGQTANIIKINEVQTLESFSQLLSCLNDRSYSANCGRTDDLIKELEYLNSAKRILKSMGTLASGSNRKCEELNYSLLSKILIEKKDSNTIFNELFSTFSKSFSCFGNSRLSNEKALNIVEQAEVIRLYSYKLLSEGQKYKVGAADKTVALSVDKMNAIRTAISSQAKRALVYMTMVSPYLRFTKSETFRTDAGLKDLKQALEKTQKELLNWSRQRSSASSVIYSYKSAVFSAVKGGPKALRGDLCVIAEMVLKNTQRDVSLNQFDELKNGAWLGFDRSSALIPLNLYTQAIQTSISLTGPLLINHEKLSSVVNGCYDQSKKSNGAADACYQLKGLTIQGTSAVRQQFMFKLLGIVK